MTDQILHFTRHSTNPISSHFESKRNGKLAMAEYLPGSRNDDAFVVMDEYGYLFVEAEPDFGEDNLFRYEAEDDDILLVLNFDLGPRFHARIDFEVGGEGYRTCDVCDRATLAGEAPDWPNGICPDCPGH